MRRPSAILMVMALLMAGGVAGCTGSGGSGSGSPGAHRTSAGRRTIVITATTGMVADLAVNIGGPHVQVEALMGPGVDPHLYKATQGDLEKLSRADLILYSGLHLEGKMVEIFERMGRRRPVLAVGEAVPEARRRRPAEFQGHFDPHVWFDVSLWALAADKVRDELVSFDPSHAEDYRRNAADYHARLDSLDAWCRQQIATIPREHRVLVTAHDAFGYFGRAYDIEVLGLQGISTVAEYGLQDLTRLVDLIVARRIPAVFVESSVPRRSVEALVKGCEERGHAVKIGGQLYSDALGAAGRPEGTYEGMVRANVSTIVLALR